VCWGRVDWVSIKFALTMANVLFLNPVFACLYGDLVNNSPFRGDFVMGLVSAVMGILGCLELSIFRNLIFGNWIL